MAEQTMTDALLLVMAELGGQVIAVLSEDDEARHVPRPRLRPLLLSPDDMPVKPRPKRNSRKQAKPDDQPGESDGLW